MKGTFDVCCDMTYSQAGHALLAEGAKPFLSSHNTSQAPCLTSSTGLSPGSVVRQLRSRLCMQADQLSTLDRLSSWHRLNRLPDFAHTYKCPVCICRCCPGARITACMSGSSLLIMLYKIVCSDSFDEWSSSEAQHWPAAAQQQQANLHMQSISA